MFGDAVDVEGATRDFRRKREATGWWIETVVIGRRNTNYSSTTKHHIVQYHAVLSTSDPFHSRKQYGDNTHSHHFLPAQHRFPAGQHPHSYFHLALAGPASGQHLSFASSSSSQVGRLQRHSIQKSNPRHPETTTLVPGSLHPRSMATPPDGRGATTTRCEPFR